MANEKTSIKTQLPLRIVCATRKKNVAFKETNTGKSLFSLSTTTDAELRLFDENTRGLSEIYNEAIDESILSPAILVFIHDDVLVTDLFWGERIRTSLKQFDILGVVGNSIRLPNQPGWIMTNLDGKLAPKENLSGAIGQGQSFPPEKIENFGPPNKECKLLDGVFIAANSEKLNLYGLRFDPQFKFHFYDIDFCRSAEHLAIKMGTCDISLIHQSYGQINQEWITSYKLYLQKWGE